MLKKLLLSISALILLIFILMYGLVFFGLNQYLWLIFWPITLVIIIIFNKELLQKGGIVLKEFILNETNFKRYKYAKLGFLIGLFFGVLPSFVDKICFGFTFDYICDPLILSPLWLLLPFLSILGIQGEGFLIAFFIAPITHSLIGLIIGFFIGKYFDKKSA